VDQLNGYQNHFALSYVNTLWTAARRKPWPAEVEI